MKIKRVTSLPKVFTSLVLFSLCYSSSALATNYSVTLTTDSSPTVLGELRYGINQVNLTPAVANSITFAGGLGTITLTSSLPALVMTPGTGSLTINGAGGSVSGASAYQIFAPIQEL